MIKFYQQNVLLAQRLKMKLPLILLFLFWGLQMQAQTKVVSGRVTDAQNNPIAGASITVKGTAGGTASGNDGTFSLQVQPGNATLVVSAVGYGTREVALGNRTEVNVALESDAQTLSDVVVVGYGTQKRSQVIGSVSQVGAKEINDRTTPQLQQALTGQLAGVTVIQRSGQPGAPGGSIQIRGIGSFGAGTAPLILVDGIPVGSMNDVDPNDVENISVLKDASSSAIYGSRASNGVILITTKSAKGNKLNIAYNSYVGMQRPTNLPEFVDSWEYAELVNEATGGGTGGFTPEEIQKFKDGSDPDNYPNINYLDAILKDHTLQTGHNFTISNKTKNTDFLVSMGYMYQDGIIPENAYNRYNLRANIGTQLRSNIRLSSRLSAIHILDRQTNGPAGLGNNGATMMGIISQAVRMPNIYPAKLSNGDYGIGPVGTHTPISLLEADGYYKARSTDLNGNLRLDWDVIKGLKLSAIGGYTQGNGRNHRFFARQRLTDNVTLGPSSLAVNTSYDNYKTFQQLAEYDKTIARHQVTVLAGHSFEEFYGENLSAARTDFPTNDITVIGAGSVDGMTNGGGASESALDSYFGRLKYSFANKYLLEGVVRYDGSSRFGGDNKYAVFPSGAVGWRISEEGFMKDNFPFISDLKLKGSYGVLGNQNIGNYPYQQTLDAGRNYGFGQRMNTGVALGTLVDPTIQWESTRTWDVGVDASILNGKLAASATYYNRYTYDILVSPGGSVSDVLGFGIGQQNSGSLENKGWEFTLDHRNRVGEFNYDISANFSTVENTVLDLGVGNIVQPNGLVGNGSRFIGFPLGMYYGYLTDGLYVDEEDVTNYMKVADQKAVNPAPKPGDIKYRDISGPDGVPDGKVDANYDRVNLGSTLPKYSFGLSLSAGYKGFTLSTLLQGVSGVQGRLEGFLVNALQSDGNIQRWVAEERWSPANPNPNAKYPRLEVMSNTGTNNTRISDYWVRDAKYLKMRNIQLSYAVPASLVSRLGMSSLRFNAAAENVFTFSEYIPGWDPELIGTVNDFYPIMRNFTFGLTANF
ncbi:MAG TPA: TonB-dependent receptor [Chitinophagaceae bacterium]